ncbi:hypothetical protein SLEP1_g1518 [Rubroshorea leprosula]|uniref:Uncharacterized protein n=1 Tax=Rubroshorea leprosula TaxID=152421 RepID=A0AAV5HE15_9ROSI|nr:hypothetical protein SLEP1_g1518 [Rubroshorea leprosula]
MGMMMVVKDEWVRVAMMDNRVVMELLVKLKQVQATPSTSKSMVENPDRVLTNNPNWMIKIRMEVRRKMDLVRTMNSQKEKGKERERKG